MTFVTMTAGCSWRDNIDCAAMPSGNMAIRMGHGLHRRTRRAPLALDAHCVQRGAAPTALCPTCPGLPYVVRPLGCSAPLLLAVVVPCACPAPPEVPSNALRAMRPHATAVTRGVRARAPVPGRDVERHPALQRRHPGALMHATIGERCWWGAEDHGEHHTLLHASWRHHVQRSPALSPCGARHSGFGHGCVPRRMSDRRHRGRAPPKVSGLTASRPG